MTDLEAFNMCFSGVVLDSESLEKDENWDIK